ncbi:MAG: hypothetical protein JSV86_17725 [Gemmatimonadota bacterium]|nr:MAG: hypothetical protein JSV86_17725 [Gemmatimonadota bacterium]
MSGTAKLRVVRAIVRPDRRGDYLERWRKYTEAARAAGAQVRLFEDQVLPGRFLEFTEHKAAKGMEGRLEAAFRETDVKGACVRREGEEVLYRAVEVQ